MKETRRQQEEIERDEHWLGGICERSAEIDAAPIKRAVRVAIEEQWLSGNLRVDAPTELAPRARQAVRGALAERHSHTYRHGGVVRVGAWMGGGLAAAAAVILSVVRPWETAPTPVEDEAVASFVTALEESSEQDEDLDQELGRLREAFSELDQTVARGWGDESLDDSTEETSDSAEDGV